MKRVNLAKEFIAEQWEKESLGVSRSNLGPLDICQQYNRWLGRLSAKIVCGTIDPDIWEPLPDKTKEQLLYVCERNLDPRTCPGAQRRKIQYRIKKTLRKAISWLKTRF
jgi:hypothetical protein